MRNEILTGIFGGLFCIIIFVSIGSFIGKASSHGPKHTDKAKVTKKVGDKTTKTDAKAAPKKDAKVAPKK